MTESQPLLGSHRSLYTVGDLDATGAPDSPTCHQELFSRPQKTFIVLCVSLAGFAGSFAASGYLLSLPRITKDFGVTSTLAIVTLTVYLVFQGFSATFSASLADAYGRRPIYVISFLVLIVACMGLGKVDTIGSMLVLRAIQAIGAGSVITIGSGTFADISSGAERIYMMRWHALCLLVGPFVGPVLSGVLAHQLKYHTIFRHLALFCAVIMIFFAIFVPETLPRIVGRGYTPKHYLTLYQLMISDRRISILNSTPGDEVSDDSGVATPRVLKRKPAPSISEIEFGQPYRFLAEPAVLLACTMSAMSYSACYAIITSQSALFSSRYGLTTREISLTFVPSCVGCILGSFVGGKVLDYHYEYYTIQMKSEAFSSASPMTRRNSESGLVFPAEEARLRALPLYTIAQVSALAAYGWTLRRRTHLAIPLILQSIIGFCSMSIFGSLGALMNDLYPSSPATITSTNNLVCSVFGAITSVSFPWILEAVGEGWAFVLHAVMCLIICLPGIWLIYTSGWKRRTKIIATGVS